MVLTLFTTPVRTKALSPLRRRTLQRPERASAPAASQMRPAGAAHAEATRAFSPQGIPNPDLVHAYMKEVLIGDDKVKYVKSSRLVPRSRSHGPVAC